MSGVVPDIVCSNLMNPSAQVRDDESALLSIEVTSLRGRVTSSGDSVGSLNAGAAGEKAPREEEDKEIDAAHDRTLLYRRHQMSVNAGYQLLEALQARSRSQCWHMKAVVPCSTRRARRARR